jgi:hypothetical protein
MCPSCGASSTASRGGRHPMPTSGRPIRISIGAVRPAQDGPSPAGQYMVLLSHCVASCALPSGYVLPPSAGGSRAASRRVSEEDSSESGAMPGGMGSGKVEVLDVDAGELPLAKESTETVGVTEAGSGVGAAGEEPTLRPHADARVQATAPRAQRPYVPLEESAHTGGGDGAPAKRGGPVVAAAGGGDETGAGAGLMAATKAACAACRMRVCFVAGFRGLRGHACVCVDFRGSAGHVARLTRTARCSLAASQRASRTSSREHARQETAALHR